MRIATISRQTSLLALVVIVLLSCSLRSEEEEGERAESAFKKTAHGLLLSGDFELLDQTAEDLRTSKAKFKDGKWKLTIFYSGLSPEGYARSENEWKDLFAKMEAWQKAFPESITRPVVHALALTDYAWKARGSGYANTVTAEGHKLMEQRLAEARKILEEAEKLPKKCPEWFSAMQGVALGQGWDSDDYEKLFTQAVKLEPTYYSYYLKKAYHLLPRWYGRPGDVERFAAEAGKKYDAAEGDVIYGRIVWYLAEYYSNIFRESQFQWERVKKSFEDTEKIHPDSVWNLNKFCRLAWLAGDKEAAHAAFEKIGDRIEPKAFGNAGMSEVARVWADPATPMEQFVPKKVLTYKDDDRVNSIAYSADGKLLIAGYRGGEVVLWDIAAGKPSVLANTGKVVSNMAISKDGKLLAAGLGGDSKDSSVGQVRLWNLTWKKEVATVNDYKMPVWSVAFSPDGKQLAVGGGQYHKRAEASIWDVEKKATAPLQWAGGHTHHLGTVVISPDGKTFVSDCNRSITVWDLVEQKQISEDKQILKLWVQQLAYSPDGKTLAAACAAMVEQPGSIVLWDTSDWKIITPGVTSPIGYATCVAFSPNGKYLAAGGSDTSVKLWRTGTWQLAATYIRHDDFITSIAFSPDGKMLASASADGAIKLWALPKE